MFSKSATAFAEKSRSSLPSSDDDADMTSTQGTIVQLIENFRLNPDLGEFVSTIYSRQFKPQKFQARQLAAALGTLAEGGCQYPNPSVQQNITSAVQKFFVALSDVMLRRPQSVLAEPEVHSINPFALLKGTSQLAVAHRPVSLSLIQLRSWSAHTPLIPYELHVHGEAAVAASLVASLQKCCPNDDIFVATPHRIQREAVKAALTRANSQLPMDVAFEKMHLASGDRKPNVIVDTIERLQGSEAAFVICLFSVPKSFTSDIGFLLERRRLNVAISRAKTLCILISSNEVLCPSVKVLANDEIAKGYAFLKAYEKRAWSYHLSVNVDNMA
uniref:DNA2/NAM7 helicase-like C-terminal domain-containing protein n=1 Tax=Psilocybe cubensis TaxID=181762 RepID=A0A8H7Y8T0_PSICU